MASTSIPERQDVWIPSRDGKAELSAWSVTGLPSAALLRVLNSLFRTGSTLPPAARRDLAL